MADAFTGEIRIFGGDFNPRLWALCNGQILAISQNTALFSILGINFGGDGVTNMQMPHLCGRAPMGTSRGPGLSPRYIGQAVGYEQTTIDERHIPNHQHNIAVSKETADLNAPTNTSLLANAARPGKKNKIKPFPAYAQPAAPIHSMNPSMLAANQAATSAAHENRQAYLAMNFIICLEGIYPSRT